jgi:hypothetical protein
MSEEFEDTKGVIRISIEETTQWPQYTKEVIRIRIDQTTQWPKEKGQKDKQRSTKYTHKTKDRITRTH